MAEAIAGSAAGEFPFRLSARVNRTKFLRSSGIAELQSRTVSAISRMAAVWLQTGESPAENMCYFPPAMVWASLAPLLESLSAESLWELIDGESMRGAEGPSVVGHIVASNTPMLAMTSVIRALLIGSGSVVKLPSSVHSEWFFIFDRLLHNVDPEIAELVEAYSWPRSAVRLTESLVRSVDKVVVYGGDDTIEQVRTLVGARLLEYGNKVSAAIVTSSAEDDCFDNLATDILMYDQMGCLSPHTIFVEGDAERANDIAGCLAVALEKSKVPAIKNTAERSSLLTEARAVCAMTDGMSLIVDRDFRWTVVTASDVRFHISPTHGLVYVVPSSKEGIIEVLMRTGSKIQGIALCCSDKYDRSDWIAELASADINYVCQPGLIQMPTIQWREDNRDVLQSLVDCP